jgi:hypothetical protein
VVTSNKPASPEQPVAHQTATVSRARYRLLIRMLTNYGYGLIALALAPTLFHVRQPPAWVTVSEIGLAMVFLALAFLIAPRGLG